MIVEGGVHNLEEAAVRGLYEAVSFRNRCLRDKKPLSEQVIRELNKRVIKYTSYDGGKYRQKNVHMSDGAFTPSAPNKIPQKMQDLVEGYKERAGSLRLSFDSVCDVVKTAAWVHCRMAKIQPFIDGNKRTSRLVTNFLLSQHGLPIVADWGGPENYFKAFYRSLELENEGPFAHFLAGRLADRISDLEWNLAKRGNASLSILREKKAILLAATQRERFLDQPGNQPATL